MLRRSLLLFALALAACDCGESPRSGPAPWTLGDGGGFGFDGGGPDEDASGSDAGQVDSGAGADGAVSDTAVFDGGSSDSSVSDTAVFDGGGLDSGAFDTGSHADAMVPDTGSQADAMVPDTGSHPDAKVPDTGSQPDASVPDTGSGNGDLWLEIRYDSSSTPRSPRWSFSSTPGWSSSDWAFAGATRAEAWDRFNNMSVVNDPIGWSLEIGGSSQLQLMFGVVRLQSFTRVLVELEGRSRATSSRVLFDVTNPSNGCGGSAMMSQDWTPDIVIVDFTPCLVAGGDLQAIRVDPTSGTIALRRLRFTIEGAVY